MSTHFEPSDFRFRYAKVAARIETLRSVLKLETGEKRLSEIEVESQSAEIWNSPERARALMRERSALTEMLAEFRTIEGLQADTETAFGLAKETGDEELAAESLKLMAELEAAVERREFRCKMNGEFDIQSAIMEINGGSGGTEAQDWAEMLLRMYCRWSERKGFKIEVMDYQPGEVAGIKSATLLVEGPFAYGHLRLESGVHRLVRISPFDSNARRHTSFASISVTPDIEQDINIEVNDSDLRVDTYRSSGAGGQHVNKTDSAVRLTHLPTGIVVACQSERSQHKNKARAMKILKSKMYERQVREQREKMDEIRGERKQIDFGSQIRNYVMQPYQLVKDLRSDYQTSDVNAVLDGELDPLIESVLLAGTDQPNDQTEGVTH
jgi:peptide chain release factor 2